MKNLPLNETEKKHFLQGITHFNAGEFYECHEEIEIIWLKEKGDLKLFYQALIMAAGGFHHVQKGRPLVAKKTLSKALLKLKGYPQMCLEVNVDNLKLCLKNWIEFLGSDDTNKQQPSFPKI